jgi:hypothetical protein
VHGDGPRLAGRHEDLVNDKHPVVAAQGLAAVVAYGVDPDPFTLGFVALGAFPGHFASRAD